MNLVIYALVSAHEISKFEVWSLKRSRSTVENPMWATRSQFMGSPKLNMSDLIASNVDLFMFLIEGIRIGTWKLRRLNWALNV